MRIALIIPFKNAAPWLGRCLRSIGSQPFEVILVDDQSTDASATIALKYCVDSAGWSYHETRDATGVSHARNVGLEAARAKGCDYITFLDADDELTNNAYIQVTAAIRENPQADIIQLNHEVILNNGVRRPRGYNRAGYYKLDGLPTLWPCVFSKVIKAELIDGIKFIKGLRHGEDELFILDCLALTRGIYCSERIATIHHKDNPQSLSKIADMADLLSEQVSLFNFMRDHEDDAEILEAIRQREASLWDNPTYKKVFGGQ